MTNIQSIRKQIFFLSVYNTCSIWDTAETSKKCELITKTHAGIRQQNTTACQSRETKRSQTRTVSDKATWWAKGRNSSYENVFSTITSDKYLLKLGGSKQTAQRVVK